MEPGTCLTCWAKNIENGLYSECPNCGAHDVYTYQDLAEEDAFQAAADAERATERWLENRGMMNTFEDEERALFPF